MALSSASPSTAQKAVFQPRFDIREVDNAYELRGELPGVEAKDLEVEFSDDKTLVIRGSSTRESTTGTSSPDTVVAGAQALPEAPTSNNVDDDAVSMHSDSSHHKATVEDFNEETGETSSTSGSNAGDSAVATPTSTVTAPEPTKTSTTTPAPADQWHLTERSVGSFQRTFQFPARVDRDAVSASLKNGVLSLLVPKAQATGSRRIEIQ